MKGYVTLNIDKGWLVQSTTENKAWSLHPDDVEKGNQIIADNPVEFELVDFKSEKYAKIIMK